MAIEVKSTSDLRESGHIKVLALGVAGSGKTRMIGTAEGGIITLASEQGLMTLRNADLPYIAISSVDDMSDAYEYLTAGEGAGVYRWVAIDSASELADQILAQELARGGDGRQAYGRMASVFSEIMKAFIAGPWNLYVTAKLARMEDAVEGGLVYGPSAPGKQVGPSLPYLFDIVLAMRAKEDPKTKTTRYWAQTHRDAQYDAKDRTGCLDREEDPPSLATIERKVRSEQKEKQK